MWRYSLSRLLKNGNRDLSLYARKIVEELIERITAFKVVE